jgi:hypothetical protein
MSQLPHAPAPRRLPRRMRFMPPECRDCMDSRCAHHEHRLRQLSRSAGAALWNELLGMPRSECAVRRHRRDSWPWNDHLPRLSCATSRRLSCGLSRLPQPAGHRMAACRAHREPVMQQLPHRSCRTSGRPVLGLPRPFDPLRRHTASRCRIDVHELSHPAASGGLSGRLRFVPPECGRGLAPAGPHG